MESESETESGNVNEPLYHFMTAPPPPPPPPPWHLGKLKKFRDYVDLGGNVKGVMQSSHWAEPETPRDREQIALTLLYGSVYITPKLGEG